MRFHIIYILKIRATGKNGNTLIHDVITIISPTTIAAHFHRQLEVFPYVLTPPQGTVVPSDSSEYNIIVIANARENGRNALTLKFLIEKEINGENKSQKR